jgi:hypothetical protein
VRGSFGEAAGRTPVKLAGLRPSESAARRTTEAAGGRAGEWSRAGQVFGERRAWDWPVDAAGRTRACVSPDATGVLVRGPAGSRAGGRMVYAGMIYDPQPRASDEEALSKPCDGARDLAGLYGPAELGPRTRRRGAQVGMDAADEWVALTDGGNGLGGFPDTDFPRAVRIPDFRHAATRRAAFAEQFRPGTAAALRSAWCHTLEHAGGAAMVRVLGRWDRRGMAADVRAGHGEVLNHLRNDVGRMDYPAYLRRGWQTASGAAEGACKTVVNQRPCLGGMRRGEAGSDAIAHLRALYRSDADQWDAFWANAA